MAKMTLGFGILLVLVSVAFWVAMGRTEMAALHPAGVGLVLLLSGALANTENSKQRMFWMHIAVTVGLIGFLLTGIRVVLTLAKGTVALNPLGFDERCVVAVICAVFVGLCVQSFIAARKARTATA